MKTTLASTTCEYCNSTLSSVESLNIHKKRNKKCLQLQSEHQATRFGRGEVTNGGSGTRFATSTAAEVETSEDIRVVSGPEVKTENDRTDGPDGKVVHPYLLGLAQIIAAQHGGRDDIRSSDNLIGFLEEEIRGFDNSCFDKTHLQELKTELMTWLDAFKHHINSVWEGVLAGVFNPARGRGGNTAVQQEVVAAYMIAKWKMLAIMSPRHKDFMLRKVAMYAKYETLDLKGTESFTVPQGSVLARVYGEGYVWRASTGGPTSGRSEYVIRTLGDWAHVISWFIWKFAMAKKVIMKRLKHPVPLTLAHNIKKQYNDVLAYLSKSPNGYTGERSVMYTRGQQESRGTPTGSRTTIYSL